MDILKNCKESCHTAGIPLVQGSICTGKNAWPAPDKPSAWLASVFPASLLSWLCPLPAPHQYKQQ